MAEIVMIINTALVLITIAYYRSALRIVSKDRDRWREEYFKIEDLVMQHTTTIPDMPKNRERP